MLTKSPAARTALVYVTVGAMVLTWTTVWYFYMRNHPPEGSGPYYIVGGLMATGFILLAIGLGVGRLGGSARNADNPAIVMTQSGPPTVVEGAAVAPAMPAPAPQATVPAPKAPPPATMAGAR